MATNEPSSQLRRCCPVTAAFHPLDCWESLLPILDNFWSAPTRPCQGVGTLAGRPSLKVKEVFARSHRQITAGAREHSPLTLGFLPRAQHTVTWRCVKLFWATRDSPISCKAQIVVMSVQWSCSHTGVTWWCPRRVADHGTPALRPRALAMSYCIPGSCQGKDACLHTGTGVERRHLNRMLCFLHSQLGDVRDRDQHMKGSTCTCPPRRTESTSTAEPLWEDEHDKTRGAATTQTDMGFSRTLTHLHDAGMAHAAPGAAQVPASLSTQTRHTSCARKPTQTDLFLA